MNNVPLLNLELYKKLKPIAIVFSAIILLVVASLRKWHWNTSIDFSGLAAFHSTINALTGIGLMLAYYFIRKKNVKLHKQLMILCMLLSGLFLLSYVVYHLTTPETKFCSDDALIRSFYFFLLITHIILAAVILPFILFTFLKAYTGQIADHKKLARWTFPLWLYIAFSGPVLYLMLRPCFSN